MTTWRILALGGDGIGPEVLASGMALLQAVTLHQDIDLEVEDDLLHGACWDRHGVFCRDETIEAAKEADAVLVGAVGGPRWDGIEAPGGAEMQDGLMRLRLELGAFAGLRPARSFAGLEDLVPYRKGLAEGADVLILREMCGGTFFAEPRGIEKADSGERCGVDTTVYGESEIKRIARAGFALARKRRGRLCSVDKANVMRSGALWREVVEETGREFPDVALEHLYADTCAYQLAVNP